MVIGVDSKTMSAITRDEVQRLAALAEIDLTDAEADELTQQLIGAIEAASKVSEVAKNAGDAPEMSHPVEATNNFRPDEVVPSLSHDDALFGAPAVEEERFAVPQILGEEP